jgi:ATP-dependent protease Clp ATPase subunit
MTPNVRNRDANCHLFPKSVPIIGSDNTIIASVAGTIKRAVYFTEDVKIVLRRSFSFSGSTFEKAGNKTVVIGNVKKVSKIAKLVATPYDCITAEGSHNERKNLSQQPA